MPSIQYTLITSCKSTSLLNLIIYMHKTIILPLIWGCICGNVSSTKYHLWYPLRISNCQAVVGNMISSILFVGLWVSKMASHGTTILHTERFWASYTTLTIYNNDNNSDDSNHYHDYDNGISDNNRNVIKAIIAIMNMCCAGVTGQHRGRFWCLFTLRNR